MLKPAQVRDLLMRHDAYWDPQRPRMRALRDIYMTDFYRQRRTMHDGVLRTEVPKGYAVVESYLGSLYAKNPAVLVEPDLRGRGNPEVAQASANQFLLTVREQFEDATRLALIYPNSAIKLAPVDSPDPLKRVSASALPPWEVIVDDTAGSWAQQRYVGHVYLMAQDEALERYGKGEEEFVSRPYTRWLDQAEGRDGGGAGNSEDALDKWIMVVELYDLVNDKLLVWSPDYSGGLNYLFTGVRVQVGALPPDPDSPDAEDELEVVHETTGIPYKTASGRPQVPIIPMYYSRDPDSPLRGYSLIDRSYDQFRELNILRTYQSQGVRRMARQWLVRAGFLDETAAAKVAEGMDGEFIEVDLPPGTPLEGNMLSVPQQPIPPDILGYANTVENDINDAGLLAPFTRGEVTHATATENNLLAQYTSSDIGRMARTRDAAISEVARVYNIILSVVLGNDTEPLSLPNPVGPTMLSADDLTGDFSYWALDSGTTPMADAAKRQSLERLAPLLISLGSDPVKIRAELLRAYDLPLVLNEEAPPLEPLPEEMAAEAAVLPPVDAMLGDVAVSDPMLEEVSGLEVPPSGKASDIALNGAQVGAAQGIVESVAIGALPRDTGVAMLSAFFNLPPSDAETIMGTVGRGFTAPEATSE